VRLPAGARAGSLRRRRGVLLSGLDRLRRAWALSTDRSRDLRTERGRVRRHPRLRRGRSLPGHPGGLPGPVEAPSAVPGCLQSGGGLLGGRRPVRRHVGRGLSGLLPVPCRGPLLTRPRGHLHRPARRRLRGQQGLRAERVLRRARGRMHGRSAGLRRSVSAPRLVRRPRREVRAEERRGLRALGRVPGEREVWASRAPQVRRARRGGLRPVPRGPSLRPRRSEHRGDARGLLLRPERTPILRPGRTLHAGVGVRGRGEVPGGGGRVLSWARSVRPAPHPTRAAAPAPTSALTSPVLHLDDAVSARAPTDLRMDLVPHFGDRDLRTIDAERSRRRGALGTGGASPL
jgi:hypothetical protein